MTIIPNQFFGHGDIHFCMTLVNRIADGRKIVWPCMPQFIDGLQRGFPHVTFVDYRQFQIDYNRRDQYEFEHPTLGRCTVLPLRWADVILNTKYDNCMRAKYDLYGLDWRMWREDAKWMRDGLKELELNKLAGAASYDSYDLVNTTFGSDCNLKIDIPRIKVPVYMDVVKGYSLFDWQHIIQNATEIHTVSTSIIYLLELLDLKAKEVHLYNRPIKGQGFGNIDYILEKHKYIYHG